MSKTTRLLGSLGSVFRAKVETLGQRFDCYAAKCARDHAELVSKRVVASSGQPVSTRSNAFPTSIALATFCGVFAIKAARDKPVGVIDQSSLKLGKMK